MSNTIPDILLYACFKNKVRFIFENETYDCGVLFLLTKGGFEFLNPQGVWTAVSVGEAVWCPPDFTFHRRATAPMELHMIKFRFDGNFPPMATVVRTPDRVAVDLETVSNAGFCTKDNMDAVTSHYCADVCLEINRRFASRHHAVDDLPYEVVQLLTERFTEDISNDLLCQMLHCSEATMISTVKKATKKTPQQLITEKRIELARRLLTETNDNVYSISEKCGYGDPLYFSRLFKNQTGLTATEFRRKYRI